MTSGIRLLIKVRTATDKAKTINDFTSGLIFLLNYRVLFLKSLSLSKSQ